MMLLDSNIIIYSVPEHSELRRLIAERSPFVSAVSYVEVLGYHRLLEEHRRLFQDFFASTIVLPLSQGVLDRAVQLRQQRRMTLGDALVAGTALAHGLILVTRNAADFQWVSELPLYNPMGST